MKVELLAHRGLWKQVSQKNSVEAFESALVAGFGIETDVRDRLGELVVSHDLPTGDEQTFEDFLIRYNELDSHQTLAINIKADGLATELKCLIERHNVENYFCFDMSVPDSRSYGKLGMPVFSRRSEFEPHSSITKTAPGIWLDGFDGTWFDSSEWEHWLKLGQSVCIVSPELHGRPHLGLWAELKSWSLGIDNNAAKESSQELGNLMLCTDFPKEFEVFQCQ